MTLRRTTRFFAPGIALACLLSLSTIWAVWYAWTASINLPSKDAAVWAQQASGERPVSLRWLWAQHNEHRLPLVKIAYVALVRSTGDFRAPAVVSALLLAMSAGLYALSSRSVRGRFAWSDAVFPLLLCSASQYATLSQPFQIQFAMNAVILSITTYLGVNSGLRASPGRLTIFTLCVLAGIGSGGVGLLTAGPLAAWVGVEAFRSRRFGIVSFLLLQVGMVLTLVALYLTGLQRPAFGGGPFTSTGFVRGLPDLASTAFIPSTSSFVITRTVGAGVCGLLFLTLLIVAGSVRRRPLTSQKLATASMAVAGMILIIGIAVGRAGWPAGTLLESRYTVLTSSVVAIVCVVSAGQRGGAWLSGLVLLGTIVFLPRNDAEARGERRHGINAFELVRASAQSGIPVEAVAQKWWGQLPAREPIMTSVLRACARHGIGPYAGLPAPRDARTFVEVPLGVPERQGSSFAWTLTRATQIEGIKIELILGSRSDLTVPDRPADDPDGPYLQPAKLDPADRATPTLTWDDASTPDGGTLRLANRLPRSGRTTVVFWFAGECRTIRLDPDVRPVDCVVKRATLLVYPEDRTGPATEPAGMK